MKANENIICSRRRNKEVFAFVFKWQLEAFALRRTGRDSVSGVARADYHHACDCARRSYQEGNYHNGSFFYCVRQVRFLLDQAQSGASPNKMTEPTR
jgi:hypothetical protein